MLFHPFKKLNPKFYIIEFITNNFCSNMNIETLFKITNCQYTKLSKLQINEIANHTTHSDYYCQYLAYTYANDFPKLNRIVLGYSVILYVNALFTIIFDIIWSISTLQHHSSSASEPIDNYKSQFQFSFKYLIEIEEG